MGLEPRVEVFCLKNVSVEKRAEQTCTVAYHKRGFGSSVLAAGGHGDLEANSQQLGGFCNFSEKICNFNAIWIKFCTFSDLFERTKLLTFESQLKNGIALLILIPPLTCRLSPNIYKSLHF